MYYYVYFSLLPIYTTPIYRNTSTVRKLIFSSVLLKKKYTRYYYSKRIFIGFCAKSYKYICIYIYGIWAFVLQKAWPLSCKTLHEGNIGRKGRYSVDFVRLSSTIWTTLLPLSLSPFIQVLPILWTQLLWLLTVGYIFYQKSENLIINYMTFHNQSYYTWL